MDKGMSDEGGRPGFILLQRQLGQKLLLSLLSWIYLDTHRLQLWERHLAISDKGSNTKGCGKSGAMRETPEFGSKVPAGPGLAWHPLHPTAGSAATSCSGS